MKLVGITKILIIGYLITIFTGIGAGTDNGAEIDRNTGTVIATVKFPCSDMNYVLIQEGEGGGVFAQGKYPSAFSLLANTPYQLIIIPNDPSCSGVITTYRFIPRIGKNLLPGGLKYCQDEKNSVNVLLEYREQSSALSYIIPDKIEVIHDGIINTYNATRKFTTINKFEKEKTYSIRVVKDGFDVEDYKTITFDTECGTVTPIFFNSSAPPNTRDIYVKVLDIRNDNPLQNAIVYLDFDIEGLNTNNFGSIDIFGVRYGEHTIRVTRDGYNDKTITINVSATSDAWETVRLDLIGTVQKSPIKDTSGFEIIFAMCGLIVVAYLRRR